MSYSFFNFTRYRRRSYTHTHTLSFQSYYLIILNGISVIIKVRPGQALMVAGGSQISRQSANECGKTTRKYSWYSFMLQTGSTSGP